MLRALLQFYFRVQPWPMFEGLWRKLGVTGIHFYRRVLKRALDRRCQFEPSCSQFTLNLLQSQDEFSSVAHRCTCRYIDCSRPLRTVCVNGRFRFFTASGRELDSDTVASWLREDLAQRAVTGFGLR